MILSNSLILSEIELELVTLWHELGRYNDEQWEEIGEGGKNNVRKVRIDLPKVGETLIRNKLEKDDYTIKKLGQIIEKMTGFAVKHLYMVNDEEFEIESLCPIPRPPIRKPIGKC